MENESAYEIAWTGEQRNNGDIPDHGTVEIS